MYIYIYIKIPHITATDGWTCNTKKSVCCGCNFNRRLLTGCSKSLTAEFFTSGSEVGQFQNGKEVCFAWMDFFASICAEAASVGKNNSMVIALQLGWRLEVVTVGHPVKKVLGVTVRHLPTSVTPNVNPWLINPGSLTVMVPPINSTWLLTW